MKSGLPQFSRILAIDPAPKGFGYAVFETPRFLVDWGIANCRSNFQRKHTSRRGSRWMAECLFKVEEIIERYHPSIIVLEDCKDDSSLRCHTMEVFIQSIVKTGKRRGVAVQTISTKDVREVFLPLGGKTKEKIAVVLARQFPELLPLPYHRERWMNESYRMSIFDAVAMALTNASKSEKPERSLR